MARNVSRAFSSCGVCWSVRQPAIKKSGAMTAIVTVKAATKKAMRCLRRPIIKTLLNNRPIY